MPAFEPSGYEKRGSRYRTSNQLYTHKAAAAEVVEAKDSSSVRRRARSWPCRGTIGHFLFFVLSITPVGLPSTANTNAVPEELRSSSVVIGRHFNHKNRRTRKRMGGGTESRLINHWGTEPTFLGASYLEFVWDNFAQVSRAKTPKMIRPIGCLRFTKILLSWKTSKYYNELPNPRLTQPTKKMG